MSAEKILTVTGPIDPALAGVTDGHSHVWINPPDEAISSVLVLDNLELITQELRDYYQAGGRTIIDCQPGGSGRDGRKLRDLAVSSRVNIVACTGFHLKEYYPPDFWLFKVSSDAAAQHFISELTMSLEETRECSHPVRAGFIKIACRNTVEESPLDLIQAAVLAAVETGCGIEIHTEKGADVERIVKTILAYGLPPKKLVLCHVDKRPDFDLHRFLAQEGVLLEYDTFYRPKYVPEKKLWPLIEKMIVAGYETQIVIATDMANSQMWTRFGGQPGLTGMFSKILPMLKRIGLRDEIISQLVGGNIISCFARQISEPILNEEM